MSTLYNFRLVFMMAMSCICGSALAIFNDRRSLLTNFLYILWIFFKSYYEYSHKLSIVYKRALLIIILILLTYYLNGDDILI